MTGCPLRCGAGWRWLAQAALPWSPHSAHRPWLRLHREEAGDIPAMLRRMQLAEQRMLAGTGQRSVGRPPGSPGYSSCGRRDGGVPIGGQPKADAAGGLFLPDMGHGAQRHVQLRDMLHQLHLLSGLIAAIEGDQIGVEIAQPLDPQHPGLAA